MHAKSGWLRTLSLTAAVAAVLVAASSAAAEVDLKAWAEAGAKTAERLQESPASWRATTTLASGLAIEVVMLRHGEQVRADFTVIRGGKRLPHMKLVIRDGLWHLTDASGSFKYRPYEAPTESPFVYMALERAQPIFLGEGYMPAAERFQKQEGDVALFREPLAPHLAKQLQAIVDQSAEFVRETGKPLSAELQAQMDFSKQLLANGLVSRVNTATGQLVEYGSPKMRTRIDDFKFLEKADPQPFAVAGTKWRDEADDPTAGDLNDLVMIGHEPGYVVGQKAGDTDARLMDVKTGRFRRLPYPGPSVRGGCFLPDRRFVIVSGLDMQTGSLRPFLIDLKKGECEGLGSPLLDTGFSLFPDASPDGKTAVVLHFDPAAGADRLKAQLCLIDLTSRKARPLGKPMDTAFMRWTADGKRLLLVSRHHKDLNAPAISSLATIDMDGQVKELRPGNMPTLLADRQTILYREPESDLWHTCDLEGKNVKLYADGLKGHGFPAPAPDGKRLLMMRFTPGKLPEPVLLSIGETQGRPITRVGGLWANPVW